MASPGPQQAVRLGRRRQELLRRAEVKERATLIGECGFCQQFWHRKRECPELDKVMAARRAAGTSPPRGFKGGGKGGHPGAGNGKGKGARAFGLDFPGLDQQMPSASAQNAPIQGSPFGTCQGGPFGVQPQPQPAAAIWGNVPGSVFGGPLRCMIQVDLTVKEQGKPEKTPQSSKVLKPEVIEPFVDANPFAMISEEASEGEDVQIPPPVADSNAFRASRRQARRERERESVLLGCTLPCSAPPIACVQSLNSQRLRNRAPQSQRLLPSLRSPRGGRRGKGPRNMPELARRGGRSPKRKEDKPVVCIAIRCHLQILVRAECR